LSGRVWKNNRRHKEKGDQAQIPDVESIFSKEQPDSGWLKRSITYNGAARRTREADVKLMTSARGL
jgi:hypothetical protein